MPFQLQRGQSLAGIVPNFSGRSGAVNIGGKQYALQYNPGMTGTTDSGLQPDPSRDQYVIYDPNNHGAGEAWFDGNGGYMHTLPWHEADSNMLVPALAAAGMMFGIPAMGLGGDGAAGAAGGFAGDATAAGYGGLDAASAASMGGGASLEAPAIATSSFEAPTAVAGYSTGAAPGELGSGSYGLNVPELGNVAPAGSAMSGGTTMGAAGGVTPAVGSGGLMGPPVDLADPSALAAAANSGAGFQMPDWTGAAFKYGAPLVGGLISSNSASKAAGQQAAATAAANATLRGMYDTTRGDLAPWRATGVQANNALADAAGVSGNTSAPGYGSLVKPFTGANLSTEPGYQFGLSEGLRAIDNRNAAGGNFLSGAGIKGADRYATDYASTKYGDAFNRDLQTKQQQAGLYSGMSTQGQNAANQTGAFGTSTAGQIAGNQTGLGNAQGAATIAGGNAISTAANGIANTYGQDQMLNQLMQQNQGGNAIQQYLATRALTGGNSAWGR